MYYQLIVDIASTADIKYLVSIFSTVRRATFMSSYICAVCA